MRLCDTCPIVCSTREDLSALQERREAGNHIAADHLENIIDHARMIEVDMGNGRIAPLDTGVQIRQQMADQLNQLDDDIDSEERHLGELALACTSGPLTLRAVKEGIEYRATICTSRYIPEGQVPHEPVYVRRTYMESGN